MLIDANTMIELARNSAAQINSATTKREQRIWQNLAECAADAHSLLAIRDATDKAKTAAAAFKKGKG